MRCRRLLHTAVVGAGVLSNLPSFLFKDDVFSVLKGGVKERQLVNEVLGSLAKFALNLGREGVTPIQRSFHSGLLERI